MTSMCRLERKNIQLRPLEELVGSFRGYNYDDEKGLVVYIDNYQVTFLNPIIAKQILNQLEQVPIGQKLGVFKVSDSKGEFVVIRKILAKDKEREMERTENERW